MTVLTTNNRSHQTTTPSFSWPQHTTASGQSSPLPSRRHTDGVLLVYSLWLSWLALQIERNPEVNNFCAMGILTPGPLQHAKIAISSVTTDRQTPDRLVECQSQWNKPQKAIAQTLEPKKFNSSTKGKVFWCVWSERDVAVIVTRSTRRRNRRTRCFRSSSTCGG